MTKEDKREYDRQRYKWLKDHHVCVICRKKDAYTLSGRVKCFECSEKSKFHIDKSNEKRREKWREEKENAIKNGFCSKCFKRKTVDGYLMCSYCRKKQRVYLDKYRNTGKIKKPEWNAYGLCAKCGKELNGQLKTNGEKSKLCSQCYSTKYSPHPKSKMMFMPAFKSPKSIEVFNRLKSEYEKVYENVKVIY